MSKQLKYGRVERERRFLLDAVPALPFDGRYAILDRYLTGTRLRLRRMEQDDGTVDYTLARKLPPHAPGALVMGNLYLSGTEYALLRQLPGSDLEKMRHYAGPWAVDVFGGALAGLILAEIEGDDAGLLAALEPPFPYVREVTDEPTFTGGHLVTLAAAPTATAPGIGYPA